MIVHYKDGDTERCDEIQITKEGNAFALVVHGCQIIRVSEFGTIARITEENGEN